MTVLGFVLYGSLVLLPIMLQTLFGYLVARSRGGDGAARRRVAHHDAARRHADRQGRRAEAADRSGSSSAASRCSGSDS